MKPLDVQNEIRKQSDPKKAHFLQRYFKTGPGEYGEGDVFAGLTVPVCRAIAKQYRDASLSDIEKLLQSEIHEERSIALMILGLQFEKMNSIERKKRIDFYLSHTDRINNWDLVDESAWMLGQFLLDTNTSILVKLAQSKMIWERRIAMIATHEFIKKKDSKLAFSIARMLLDDKNDLIHKAVGWMLREIEVRCSKSELEIFLRKYYTIMPRTTLRYAIEHFPDAERKKYLRGEI